MKKKNILPTLMIAGIMLAIILNPGRYIVSAANGAALWALTVLPALFPFFFFSKLLCMFDADKALGRMLGKPMRLLYNSPPAGGYIFIMSLLSGYPIGAKLIGDYKESGMISKDEAHSLAAIASTSGPLFILGTIGSLILKNSTAGVIILVSHYISAIVNGLIYRGKNLPESLTYPENVKISLRDSIYSAVISILIVGGYIIVFSIVCDLIKDIGLLGLISGALKPVFGPLAEGMLLSLIEVTRGSVIIGVADTGIILKTAAIAAGVTFGGMSVILQSITFLGNAGIKTGRFMLMKGTQCVVAYFTALGLGFLFLPY
jgi:sporulation integral membrane protein YlbJ